jgi:hypothetical protein
MLCSNNNSHHFLIKTDQISFAIHKFDGIKIHHGQKID